MSRVFRIDPSVANDSPRGVGTGKDEDGPRQNELAGSSVSLFFRGLEVDDVLGSRALLAVYHVKLNLCTLGQTLEALALDGAVMAENVLLSVVARDEAEAFFVIEPLDCSRYSHVLDLTLLLQSCIVALLHCYIVTK